MEIGLVRMFDELFYQELNIILKFNNETKHLVKRKHLNKYLSP